MPKIRAPTIADHVAAQEHAVFDAAVALLTERGARNVTISDIAEAAGLKRTSFYRYFPTKAAVVHRWFETVIAPLVERSDAIARSDATRHEKLARWVELELDFHADARNQAMIRCASETDDMPEETRAAIGRRHQDLYASLHAIVAAPGTDSGTAQIRVDLIATVIHALIDLTSRGLPAALARQELLRTATAIADLPA